MLIKSAEFVMSNSDVAKCPKSRLPEYAFIGRSNVGKSSLINMLTGRKSLAKTSGKPGKTQLINHFLINKNWHLVDLPGYGYAKVSKSAKKVFQKFITQYFLLREQLVNAFILVDIRHKPQPIDLEFMEWLGENGIPFSIIFTKADKLKPNAILRHVEDYKTELLKTWEDIPIYFITSSSKDIGKYDILNYIEQLNGNMELDSFRMS
ncbi:ribosome biogenesis GTP-binding protein YihA/YsxC [Litoribaculum gwangyangense]|uniref:Probable GTP-binding protein EngB n=1 Tax=Litoribaculum gwangyangense TaxID=1130722 RepID=A0ABP9CKL1_9FLAO